jgi:L-alanine-DL-glutamate epimerase-like enolase superfamily enzyme
MKMNFRKFDLKLAHQWTVASGLTSGKTIFEVVLLDLTDSQGVVGLGESAPASRYKESVHTVMEFLQKIDANKLSFDDVAGSMEYLETFPGNYAAKCAVNIALMDGAARKAGKAIYDFLNLGFKENAHRTSFSIGIAAPDLIRKKVLEAEQYPILKLKVGGPDDRENMKALRDAAPKKIVRIDANEGWKTKEEALTNLEWFAEDPNIEFCEQPMHSSTPRADWVWLKARTPVPIFADESFHHAKDAEYCAECFHGVNAKLIKTGGISGAYEALQAARKLGLKTMIGCMIETSILTSAAANLAELTNHLDIDGNLLCTNDPFVGPTSIKGMVSFTTATEKTGLRVRAR